MEAPAGSKSKDRTLDDKELVKVWNTAPDDPFGRIVKLLILCGQRPGRDFQDRPEDDVSERRVITLPDWLTKNKLEHRFPFPGMAETALLHHLSRMAASRKPKPGSTPPLE